MGRLDPTLYDDVKYCRNNSNDHHNSSGFALVTPDNSHGSSGGMLNNYVVNMDMNMDMSGSQSCDAARSPSPPYSDLD
jgi:hypothetical protein